MDNREELNNEIIEEDSPADTGLDFIGTYNAAKPQKAKHTAKKTHRKMNKGVIKIVIWIVSIVIVSSLLAGVIIVGTGEYLGIGTNRGKDCVVEITKGMSTKQIAAVLKQSKAINNEFAFRIYSKLKGFDGKYMYGVYTFNNEIGYEDLAEMLMTEGARAETVTVTIPEGSTIDEMAKRLEEKGVCTAKDFRKAVSDLAIKSPIIDAIPIEKVYYRLEGYLFPDTYNFYCYDSEECAKLAVIKMFENMENLFDAKALDKINSMGYTTHEILTMASIIQLEAGNTAAEMPNVAQVFYNRLNDPAHYPTLGSSPTRKYPYGDGKYNTYITKGLPVGPLCAPSKAAVEAAINPNTKLTATFFVTDAKMQFYYRNTLAEHNAIIAKLKREKNWIYED